MTTLTGLTVRPIRFTADLPGWQRLVETLGGTLISKHPGWLVYQLGSGRLALHASNERQPAGTVSVCFETPAPLEEAAAAARTAGVDVALEQLDHGLAGVVRASDGVTVTLDAPTEANREPGPTDPRTSVLQIWYGADVTVPRSTVEALGARARLVGDDGTWTDLTCPGGGLVGIHGADSSGTELAFEWDGDVEDALRLLETAGIEAVLIDETYGRTVQVTDPDGTKEIWINERQTDLYGYTDASA